jgi:phosphohistidine phosphatase
VSAARRAKTLYLFRHAKSSWDDPALTDFDRPLNKRGEKAAPLMGKVMRARDVCPSIIICSPAKRTRQTAKLALKKAGLDEAEIVFKNDLYLATTGGLLEIIHKTDDLLSTAMLIGHNPGLSELVYLLTGVEEAFPTAALACLRLNVAHWKDVRTGCGKMEWIVRPRQVVR